MDKSLSDLGRRINELARLCAQEHLDRQHVQGMGTERGGDAVPASHMPPDPLLRLLLSMPIDLPESPRGDKEAA